METRRGECPATPRAVNLDQRQWAGGHREEEKGTQTGRRGDPGARAL